APYAHALRRLLAQDSTDMVTDGARRGGAAQIRGAYRATLYVRLQGFEQACSSLSLTEKIEHHLSGPDGRQGIRNAPAFDVWGRAVHRFEHGGVGALRIEVGAGSKAHTTHNHS